MILDRQQAEGWGAKVIDRDLQNEFPGQQGFSPRNLKYMRAFAEAWPETAIGQAPLAQSARPVAAIVHQAGAQLPWKHLSFPETEDLFRAHCVPYPIKSSADDSLDNASLPSRR